MADLNDSQFPKAGSLRFKRNRDPEIAMADYVTEDQSWMIEKERRDRWHVNPTAGGEPLVFPTMRDAVDYSNHPAEWEPEHKQAWLQGLQENQ